MAYYFKKRTRQIARYNTRRTFLDVYDADAGLILYSHPLEDDGAAQWSAQLSPDGRYTVLWCSRRELGEDRYEVTVYDTASSARLYALPDPRITFDPSGEFAYRIEVMGFDSERGVSQLGTVVIDALSGEELQRYLDDGERYNTGIRPYGEPLAAEDESPEWFNQPLPLAEPDSSARVILPGAGIMAGGGSLETASYQVFMGQSDSDVLARMGAPEQIERQETLALWHYLSQGMMVVLRGGRVVYLSLFSGAPRPFSASRYKPFAGCTREGICMGAKVEEVTSAYGAPEKDIEMHFAALPFRWLDYSTTLGIEFSFLPVTGQLYKIDLSRP